MSATALPITSSRFAAALRELPVSALHAKVSELQNAIAHLQKSNEALEEFVREEDDKDCYEALMENREVVERNKERIELIRKEVVELRGLPWVADEVKTTATASDADAVGREAVLNGVAEIGSATSQAAASASTNGTATATATANGHPQEETNTTSASEAEEGVFL
ncbi:hypothetical protein K505DRAFT_81969 [Melanomma pulvis-pyrius CBS 109.77]|uniref:Uncharacterized protein n=1 Tax=Melanomma pulvis-pyrius CBS 109.77 TaxID=1314802 RepID=A0A6A6X1R5_9PLEO|nr:hypothetical protein K505DRAFT_81969 [Melanomma pulvis-pyrius CBS 109.77]